MSWWELFLYGGETICLLTCSLTCVFGSYKVVKIQWIDFTNNCFEIFGNQSNFDKIIFFNKENKQKYLFLFYLFFVFNFLSIITIIILIWPVLLIIGNKTCNIILVCMSVFIFILSYVCLYFLIKKFLKEIKKIGICSKAEATNKFNDFKNEISKKLKPVISFEILKLKNDKQTIYLYNNTLQRLQKRYKRKIEKLLSNEKQHLYQQDICLLNIFVKYLKRYAYGLKMINQQNNENIINFKVNNKIYNIEKLPEILINNFFAFTKF